ncbi:3-dehydroquinate dehydratase, type I [Enterococcus sp. 7E2_DIV0204]|uniref:type I 3-dehydroquinate dehydratase n=1 Tax=unclassified Enterococcus TaxID=2608891 RepID=UPI000A33CD52|nr:MULTISPECIES: type I 3-dehydroquinate dehydratase [unclassified Enterococcus]OTN90535.1 3-dehydroquinate dehydratase, type I [Enterococcus sp. 7E2_DIV0204]OTP52991.1 3-dehydroquinate dehydratase, type I [Enterococcus sp. 7D2_DIV0200]
MNTVTVKNVTIGSESPKIIVPLVGKNETELIEEAKHLLTIDCDLVEWRVDFFDQVTNFEAAAEMSKKIAEILSDKPILFTFRTKQEGGELAFTDEQYFGLYKTVIEHGAIDLLDVELFMDDICVQATIKAAHEKAIKIVMCNHDFDKTPTKEEIVSRLCKMQEKNADICKIAVMPQSSDDVLRLLEATNEMNDKHADRPIVTMSMGQLGMVSRMCGEVFGSAMTFGAAKKASAPGQVPVAELRKILRTLAL